MYRFKVLVALALGCFLAGTGFAAPHEVVIKNNIKITRAVTPISGLVYAEYAGGEISLRSGQEQRVDNPITVNSGRIWLDSTQYTTLPAHCRTALNTGQSLELVGSIAPDGPHDLNCVVTHP